MRGTRQKRSVLASAVVCAVAATGTVTLTATAGSGGRLILDAAGPPLAAATEPEPIELKVNVVFPCRSNPFGIFPAVIFGRPDFATSTILRGSSNRASGHRTGGHERPGSRRSTLR